MAVVACSGYIHAIHINLLQVQFVLNYIKISSFCSTGKTNWVHTFIEIIIVCFENHTEHLNTLCGQNAEFFKIQGRGAVVHMVTFVN
jgi:hypothetical protein